MTTADGKDHRSHLHRKSGLIVALTLTCVALLVAVFREPSQVLLFKTTNWQRLEIYVSEDRIGRTPLRISVPEFRRIVAKHFPGATSLDPGNPLGCLFEPHENGRDYLIFEPGGPRVVFKQDGVEVPVKIEISGRSDSKITRVLITPVKAAK